MTVGLPAMHDPSTTNPAALYAVRVHHGGQGWANYRETVIADLRRRLPAGAAILDRSDLHPLESFAGTTGSIRLVDAVVLVGRRPRDQQGLPDDPRIDFDAAQREVAEAAAGRGVMVIVQSHDGDLHRLEDCRRSDQRDGMRLVPPDADDEQ